MMPLAYYQMRGRQLEQARIAGDARRIAELEAELCDAPAVIRYLYLGDVPPPALGHTPPPPADQRAQLLHQVRAPAAVPDVPVAASERPSPPPGSSTDVAAGTQPRSRALRPPPWSTAAIHNVMVVDDDARMLAAWKRAARDHSVFVASDAAAARQLASSEKLDLAIVELRLGNTSGIDLIRDLKRDLPDLMVVLCSSHLSVAAAVAAIRVGADIVVFKPITFREILQRIEQNAEQADPDDNPTLTPAEWAHMKRALTDCNGDVSMASRRLGIYPRPRDRHHRMQFSPQKMLASLNARASSITENDSESPAGRLGRPAPGSSSPGKHGQN